MNSTGSARVIVGITLGTAFSIGVLALTALWRPPEERKTPLNVSPEIIGTEIIPPNGEITPTAPPVGAETGAEPLPPEPESLGPEGKNVPASPEKPKEPAPVKKRPSEPSTGNPGSPPQPKVKEDITSNSEPEIFDKIQEEGNAEGG